MQVEIYNKMKTNSIKDDIQFCDNVICNSGNALLETHILISHSSCCRSKKYRDEEKIIKYH